MPLEKPIRFHRELPHRPCPRCNGKQYCYRDGNWTEWICWICAHYESDTPAFTQSPHLYHDIVRKNGRFFMSKYAYYARVASSRSAEL